MYRDKSPDGNRDKGRCDREAIPAAVGVMKLSEPGKQVAACGRVAGFSFHEFALRSALGGLESVL